MKKLLLSMLAICLTLTFVACGDSEAPTAILYTVATKGEGQAVDQYEITYEGELTVELLSSELSKLTGYDFHASKLEADNFTIDWAAESSLVSGASQPKSAFAFDDPFYETWFLLDSMLMTVSENMGVEEIYYTQEGGGYLMVNTGFLRSFNTGSPYMGSAIYNEPYDITVEGNTVGSKELDALAGRWHGESGHYYDIDNMGNYTLYDDTGATITSGVAKYIEAANGYIMSDSQLNTIFELIDGNTIHIIESGAKYTLEGSGGSGHDGNGIEGEWIMALSHDAYVTLTIGGGHYTRYDGTNTTLGTYQFDGTTATLTSEEGYTSTALIGQSGGLSFTDGSGLFEKEIPFDELYSYVTAPAEYIVGRWERNGGGDYFCAFNDNGTFYLTDPRMEVQGSYEYVGGEILLQVDDGSTISGYILSDPENPQGIGLLYLHGLAENYSPPSQSTQASSSVVGDWYNGYNDVTIHFYPDFTYRITPGHGLSFYSIPSVGSYYEGHGMVNLVPFGGDSSSEVYWSLTFANDGSLDLNNTSHSYLQETTEPTGLPPTEVPTEGDLSGEGGAIFELLGLAVNMQADGSIYTLANGGYKVLRGDDVGDSYERHDIGYSVEILHDEIIGDQRQIGFEAKVYFPYDNVPDNSADYNFFWRWDFYDYDTGYLIPTETKYAIPQTEGISAFKHEVPYNDGLAYIELAYARDDAFRGEQYYLVTTYTYVIEIPEDYPHLVFAALPRQATFAELNRSADIFSNSELGLTIDEVDHVDIYNALYCRIE